MTDTVPSIPAPAEPPNAPQTPVKELGPLRQAVNQHVHTLQIGYLGDRAEAVQALARLRRGVGRQPTRTPDLWGLVGVEAFHAAYLTQRRHTAPESEALRAERAAHVAITLWAVHQQSNRSRRMHVPDGPSVGTAVRRLMSGTDADDPVRKRFVRAGTSSTLDVLAQRLRDLVTLMRTAEVPLDYGLLAEQLDQWQRPGGAGQVRQAWGRSFHAYRPPAPRTTQDQGISAVPLVSATNEMRENE
ncbi:CRISPR system Cascade subunit CasB [Streptomyces sp. CG 926]|uniref:type I-E CRISPR-associated protein Cse2/CasB n=1 Tax=Streptomyces sp. CG 926 TaxID=1882405 RepID=UPI000D6D68E8|nr:type I-E CRISPR-associated protein Cse2/CasB [Streptomyces sp. CG 926]PWK64002.1 CRISPR system Cascade subunit CasB [Streptomyces sp. CG 926]